MKTKKAAKAAREVAAYHMNLATHSQGTSHDIQYQISMSWQYYAELLEDS